MRKRQEKILAALLEHSTVVKAAASINVVPSTIFRALQDPSFVKSYNQAKKQLVTDAISKLQKAAAAAVDTLMQIMGHESPPPGSAIRVSCARIILETSIKTSELQTLMERVEALEGRFK